VLQLRTFGGLSIEANGAPLTGAAVQRKTLALLSLLAAAGKNGLSRDKLVAYLWPESDAEHSRSLLKQACYALRRDLHEPELLLGATELRLNPDVITSDVQAFEEALRVGDRSRAVELYCAPFLDGFYLNEVEEFERWVEDKRARLAEQARNALESLATAAAASGDARAAVAWWRRLTALDPLNSHAAVGLMTALAALGERGAAIEHGLAHAALWQAELHAAPPSAVTELVERLRHGSGDLMVKSRDPGAVAGPEPVKRESAPGDAVTEAAPPPVPRPQSRRVGMKLALGAALATLLGAELLSRPGPGVELDPNLLAVAPFDVFDPKLAIWHEGLVDVLSRSLDGAGPVRTVAPTVVIRRWEGHADPASAKNLAGRTGARFVIFGQLLGSGRDSVLLRAAVLDAHHDRALPEIDRADEAGRIDRLADSLSVDVIRALAPATFGTHVRLYSVGTKSLPALKAFLQGERFFRRFALDSAIASFDRAVALDTTFALAFRRLQLALGWNDSGPPAPGYFFFRAAAFNHGLGPRDSLLIAIDTAAPGQKFAMLERAARRYPQDPEIWYQLGEVRFHFEGGSWKDARAAFDRAIALDSEFAPAYIHPVEIALNDNDPGAAFRYARGSLANSSVIPEAGGIRLLSMLLDPQRPRPWDFDRELEAASRSGLFHVALAVQSWPDASETQILVARRAVVTARARVASAPADTGDDDHLYLAMLPSALIYRGHLQEARRMVGDRFGIPFMELAEMGAIPRETVEAALAQWFHHHDDRGFSFFPWFADGPCHRTLEAALWWGSRRDTARLQRLVSQEESGARAVRNVAVAIDARPAPGFARAALALARGDTSLALSRFLALPDSLCFDAPRLRDVRFRLLVAAGRGPEAAAVFDRSHDRRVPLMLERARLAERLGDRPTAIKYYEFVAQAWLHADPELQPTVAEARASLERLVRFQPFRPSHRKVLTP